MIRKNLILLFCISSLLLSSCSSRSYEDGYAAGYDAGYQAALRAYQSSADSNSATKSAEGTGTLAEPTNGYIFQEIPDCDYLAPLSIETTGNNGYYFVLDPLTLSSPSKYVSDEYTKIIASNTYIRLYIRGGASIEIQVPLGEYEVYYATGDSWYGEDELFGDKTRYFKCDDTFSFEETSAGYNGWTISLTPVPDGNLDTDSISESDFPK